ncbi:MAG: hypothetical protein A2020_01950 [Lentisphaerae bacterium GWF2_45_14]|nr:MAG: hypothetical protein A2020_01950 [Lentisphaerae bacterium GWF2_45_14]
MRFQCPFCRGLVAVENSDLGIDVQCGHCGEVVTVPYSRVATGAVIADFIILEELGRGGMGVVYLAHQISLDRSAAVKILADSYINNAEFVVNFIKEARAAAKLNHPHIVQAYAVGEDEGIFYFAMENIDGETMKSVLKREKVIPLDMATSIIQQIAEALDYAWKEQKLIHRDIKPDNIMLTRNGRAKLADLGLSRVAGELDDAEGDEVMGTPQYISPEHLTGAPMDIRSDIYSLGATFFHLITGKFPFEGKTATEIARKHLEEKLVPPHLVNPEIPQDVSQVIVKMMEKNIKRRYQDAQELVEDLRLLRRGKTPSTATEGISRKRKTGHFTIPSSSETGSAFGKTRASGTELGKTSKMASPPGSGSGTLSGAIQMERTSRRRPILMAAIAVLVLIGGTVIVVRSLIVPSSSPPLTIKKPPREPVKQQEVKRPAAQGLPGKITEVIDFITANPAKRGDILRKCEELLAQISPSEVFSDEDKSKIESIRGTFLKIDEERLEIGRNKLRSKYNEEFAIREVTMKKAKEEEKRRNEIQRKKSEREEQLRKVEEEKQQEIARHADEYVKFIENSQNSMRRRFIDFVRRGNYKEAIDVFSPALEELEKASDKSPREQEAAKSFAEWAKKMQAALESAKKLQTLITTGGKQLEGTQIEFKEGALGAVQSISDGVITIKMLLRDRTVYVPVKDLEISFLLKFLKKASEKVGDPNAYFYYLIANGNFYRIKSIAPDDDWAKEGSQIAYEYLKLKLKHASSSEKLSLRKEYGKLPEYRRALKDYQEDSGS